jgi:hypothetical protein
VGISKFHTLLQDGTDFPIRDSRVKNEETLVKVCSEDELYVINTILKYTKSYFVFYNPI